MDQEIIKELMAEAEKVTDLVVKAAIEIKIQNILNGVIK